MGQLVLAAAGAVIGGFFGMPQVGWAIGSALGGVLFAPKGKTQIIDQPLADPRILALEYGRPIPRIFGSARIAGQVWANSARRKIETYTVEEQGGKGGGGGQTTITITRTYEIDVIFGLTLNEIAGIRKIWDEDGTLIFSIADESNVETINISIFGLELDIPVPNSNENWSSLTIYTGTSTQLPDPTYETYVKDDDGNLDPTCAIGFRDRSYVSIAGLKLGQSGRMRNLNFEVVANGSTSQTLTWVAHDTPLGSPTPLSGYKQGVYCPEGEAVVMCGPGSGITPGAGEYTSFLRCDTSTADEWERVQVSVAGQIVFFGSIGYYPPDQKLIAVSLTTGPVRVYKSLDFGVTWTPISGAVPTIGGAGSKIAYNPLVGAVGRLLFVNFDSYSYSDDGGENWATATFSGVGTVNVNSVCYAGGDIQKFVACGNAVSTTHSVFSSVTGVAWTGHGDPTNAQANLKDVDWDDDLELICVVDGRGIAGTSDTIATTADLSAWSLGAGSNQFTRVAGGPAGFMACALDGATYLIQSGSSIESLGSFPGSFIPTAMVWADAWKKYVTACSNVNTQGIKTYAPYTTLSLDPPSVATVQALICEAAGYNSGQYDVSDLENITRKVDCLLWADVSSGRSISELLMANYFYECVVNGNMLEFIVRGGDSSATVLFTDLGASEGDPDEDPLQLKKINDLERPAMLTAAYMDVSRDYQTDVVPSDRVVSTVSQSVSALSMRNFGTYPTYMKQAIDAILLDQVASKFTTTIRVLAEFFRNLPTDVLTVIDSDGSEYRFRIVNMTDSFPVFEFDLLLDDPTVFEQVGIMDLSNQPSADITLPQDTELSLLDIPLLRDTDDYPGIYLAAVGSDNETYPGAAVFDSPDDVNYTRKATIDVGAVAGVTTTALNDWAGGRVFDELSSVTVNLGTTGTLTSSTRALLLAGPTNAAMVGGELIQYRTVTVLQTTPNYIATLTGLLRGCRGTNLLMTGHTIGEDFVLLTESALRSMVLQNNELGVTRYYKGVTLGRPISSADSEAFVVQGVRLKCLSPAYFRVTRDASGNAVLNWVPRSRRSVRMIGTLGFNFPMETVEAYEIDIFASSAYSAVLATLEASTNSVAFSAAAQTALGLTPLNRIYVHIRQVSPTVGPGDNLEAYA